MSAYQLLDDEEVEISSLLFAIEFVVGYWLLSIVKRCVCYVAAFYLSTISNTQLVSLLLTNTMDLSKLHQMSGLFLSTKKFRKANSLLHTNEDMLLPPTKNSFTMTLHN